MRFRPTNVLLVLLLAATASADDEFAVCLAGLQQQALDAGVAEPLVMALVPGLERQARVLELDRQQPEFVQTFAQYLDARVTPARIERGRVLYRQHRDFLRQLTREYGVPGQYLIAFWGLETNFGSYLGRMPTLDSLATLACDARRSEFFSAEFIAALQLLQREELDPAQMRGSWAGAVGHTQFMPTSYLRYAVDGDGDGTVDLWRSEQDALASGANLLRQLGWQPDLRWGREVQLQRDFPFELAGPATRKPQAEWAQLGVRRADGAALDETDEQASVLLPAGYAGPAFLVYDNFDVIMHWNRSESYGISVGHLADRITGEAGLRRPPPANQQPLSRQEIEALQTQLNRLGFAAGDEDGLLGPATRAALATFQRNNGLVADGYPDRDSLEKIQQTRDQ
ncbi:lytic murein transglycosylase [Kineobactrum salinum]|uniref:Lytic murein transglycosylase n=1 Tax=Kineobactrum salinum TaxID=2708301 RepID=A0A6C0U291_9GAMM|nr:lytic murein transglycosylase [Kineobactrum salinum]QIB65933.1 lytic murein transglycosylase [Kineobactrum salinum]